MDGNTAKIMLLLWLVWNGTTFLIMGLDKYKATHHKWRISERALLLSAFLMGAAGSSLGAIIFRHKIRKTKFRILLPMSMVINLLVFVYFIIK